MRSVSSDPPSIWALLSIRSLMDEGHSSTILLLFFFFHRAFSPWFTKVLSCLTVILMGVCVCIRVQEDAISSLSLLIYVAE